MATSFVTLWTDCNLPVSTWNFPDKNTEMGCHLFLQGIFSTQGLNLCIQHRQASSLPLSHQWRPRGLNSRIWWFHFEKMRFCHYGKVKRFEVNWCPLFYSPYVFNMGYIHLSVQFSSVKSLSRVQLFVTHGPQHARPPCPSPTHGVYPNSCPLSRWCHSTISFSVVPFSSCLQSYLASRSFQMSQLFASGDQTIGVSASAAVLPVNI